MQSSQNIMEQEQVMKFINAVVLIVKMLQNTKIKDIG